MGRRRRWDEILADPCPRPINQFGYDHLHIGYILGSITMLVYSSTYRPTRITRRKLVLDLFLENIASI